MRIVYANTLTVSYPTPLHATATLTRCGLYGQALMRSWTPSQPSSISNRSRRRRAPVGRCAFRDRARRRPTRPFLKPCFLAAFAETQEDNPGEASCPGSAGEPPFPFIRGREAHRHTTPSCHHLRFCDVSFCRGKKTPRRASSPSSTRPTPKPF